MTFWSGERLLANKSVIEGFDNDNVDVNSYKLHMGSSYFRTTDDAKVEQKRVTLDDGEAFVIPPGQFAFLVTKEKVHVPTFAMALISMRTSVKFQGLINVSGFHVDPGYNGKLIYSVYNASPSQVHLSEGDYLFKIWFADLDQETKMGFRGEGNNEITNDMVRGLNRETYSLQALSEKIRDLETKVDLKLAEYKPAVDNLTLVWRTLIVGVVALALAAAVTPYWTSISGFVASMVDWVKARFGLV